ncbi:hypothetical protein PRUB_a1001 [Pseudoalteromonas rubra]|uniref:Uncharacterized protein n=1 Tax=Pseudoalteromonas rubra TaxID=43658 RepID=A0A8T0C7R9_9GAMM|nr:hypothetical protein [Pseudoalteromonas rubra]KAF7786438.1 hypothetical protein PRUB_a1001 [Pseudoalteromonas rubra]
MFQLIMMVAGLSFGIYSLCQGFGLIKIKNSDVITQEKLNHKKQASKLSGLLMCIIGIIYALELVNVW